MNRSSNIHGFKEKNGTNNYYINDKNLYGEVHILKCAWSASSINLLENAAPLLLFIVFNVGYR
jgi:hypothetical protein